MGSCSGYEKSTPLSSRSRAPHDFFGGLRALQNAWRYFGTVGIAVSPIGSIFAVTQRSYPEKLETRLSVRSPVARPSAAGLKVAPPSPSRSPPLPPSIMFSLSLTMFHFTIRARVVGSTVVSASTFSLPSTAAETLVPRGEERRGRVSRSGASRLDRAFPCLSRQDRRGKACRSLAIEFAVCPTRPSQLNAALLSSCQN